MRANGAWLKPCAAGDDAGEPGRGVTDTAAMNLVLLRLIGLYAGLSVLAFGGGNGVIPAARRRPSASLAFRRGLPGYIRHLPRRAWAGVADRGVKAAGMAGCRLLRRNFRAIPFGVFARPATGSARPVRLAGGVGAPSCPIAVGPTFARCPRPDAQHGLRLLPST